MKVDLTPTPTHTPTAHPEDKILEKESVLMILPSVSMERKVGAHGCWKDITHLKRCPGVTMWNTGVKLSPCRTAGSSRGRPR